MRNTTRAALGALAAIAVTGGAAGAAGTGKPACPRTADLRQPADLDPLLFQLRADQRVPHQAAGAW
jgi:hypothetical protein